MKRLAFLQHLTKLNRAYVAGKGKAPHKSVFMLSLADWFEEHPTANHTIPFDEKLISLFREKWGLLVSLETYTGMLILQPFFYLKKRRLLAQLHRICQLFDFKDLLLSL